MSVVINEFEVLPPAPVLPAASERPSGEPPPQDKPAPSAVVVALRALEVRALRAWAH